MRNIGVGAAGLPPGTEMIPGPLVQVQAPLLEQAPYVWLPNRDQSPILHAELDKLCPVGWETRCFTKTRLHAGTGRAAAAPSSCPILATFIAPFFFCGVVPRAMWCVLV
jgi:hypothetical protein